MRSRNYWFVAAIVVAALLVPQAVLAAAGSFTSSSSTPAVTAKNSANGGPAGRFVAQGYGVRALQVDSTWDDGPNYGIYATAKSPAGRAIGGFNTARSGYAIGVSGQTDSAQGRAINGLASSTWGNTTAGYFDNRSSWSRAVGLYGWASNRNTDQDTYGVYGRSESSAGTGVRGVATGRGGWGVYGYGGNTGVFGDGNDTGVFGRALAADGAGVYGASMSATDRSFGVLSGTNLGVVGHIIAEQNQNVAGFCTIQAQFNSRECLFHLEGEDSTFPDGTTPIVVMFPLNSNPGDYHYWIENVTRERFTIKRDSPALQGHAQAFNWIVVGVRPSLLGVPTGRPPRTHNRGD